MACSEPPRLARSPVRRRREHLTITAYGVGHRALYVTASERTSPRMTDDQRITPMTRPLTAEAAITAIADARAGRALPLPCCNDIEHPDLSATRCGGTMTPGWPTYVCDTCRAQCGAAVHPQHSTTTAPQA